MDQLTPLSHLKAAVMMLLNEYRVHVNNPDKYKRALKRLTGLLSNTTKKIDPRTNRLAEASFKQASWSALTAICILDTEVIFSLLDEEDDEIWKMQVELLSVTEEEGMQRSKDKRDGQQQDGKGGRGGPGGGGQQRGQQGGGGQ